MRKAREILRLKFEAELGNHKIGRACGVSASTVWDTVARFQMTGLGWPLPAGMSEAELERRLYRRPGDPQANPEHVPDWAQVQQELRNKHVTLRLLWEEYKAEHSDGFQYSWYCERYREWRKRIDVVMRQEHKLGERVFTDWAGDTIPLTDALTGEILPCYLFVAVLGASNYTYAEPSLSRTSAPLPRAARPRILPTCPRSTGATPSGVRSASSAGRALSVRRRNGSSRPFLSATRTRPSDTAPVLASFAWSSATPPPDWSKRRPAPWPSAARATRA